MRCNVRTKLLVSAILALLLAVPGQAFAQAKIKVAIWEFENHADGYFTRITYEHWPLKERPPAELFAPDVSNEKFLSRFERLLSEAGLGARIRSEIEASNAQLTERSAPGEPSEAATQ